MTNLITEFYKYENNVLQEAFSTLRSNIGFHKSDKKIKKLVVASYKSGEGKTTTAINLAINYAQSGQKTLLIDTDLRKPSESKIHGLEIVSGFSKVILEGFALEEVVRSTNIENLFYIASGQKHIDPTGYFASEHFDDFLNQAQNVYDFIIMDTPPLGSVIDAAIIASKADAAVMVVSTGRINLSGINRAKEQLQKADVNLIGIILNKVKKSEYRKYFEIYGSYLKNKAVKRKWRKKK